MRRSRRPPGRSAWSGLAEAQPVEQRDRPRAHRDDVAQDPADAGRGALERLDRGRVVVALDLERDRLAVAEVDHARVLARPLEHALAAAREALQQQRRVLVAAVLRPEQREDGELEVVRLALEQLADTVELPVGETERAVERLFRDLRQAASLAREGRRPRRRYPERDDAAPTARCSSSLAAIWGASYLFIKVGVRDFEPTRADDAAAADRRAAAARLPRRPRGRRARRVAQVRGAWREGLVFGAINGALPFTLIAWGEKHIDSGVAAIANASVPIFVAILAIRFNPSERSSGLRLVGILVGLVGVGVLAGVHPEGGSVGAWSGRSRSSLASFSYAVRRALRAARARPRQPGPVLATASMLYGGARPAAVRALPAARSRAGLEAGRLAARARGRAAPRSRS